MTGLGGDGAKPAVRGEVKGSSQHPWARGDARSAQGALGGPGFAQGEEGGHEGLEDEARFGAHGARLAANAEGAKHGALERLEARLEKLAQLRSTEAQILRAIARDLRVCLDELAPTSPDGDVEKTPQATPANAPAHEQLLDARGLATVLCVTTKTVRRWRDEGRLPAAIDFGGTLRWRRSTVEAWLAEREEALR